MGFLDRLAEQRLSQITSHAREYLDSDEHIRRWVRAKNPDGRGEGFIYLTEKHCVIHWRGRPEAPGAIALQDITSWGVARETSGGPILGIEANQLILFVQLPVSTRAMAEHATAFITEFAQWAPAPAGEFTHGSHLGAFQTDAEIEVEGKPKPLSAHARRVAVTVLGLTLILLGIAIIPLPGPWSFIINISGLAILASEYDWAKDALDWVRGKYRTVANKIKSRRSST
jgi:uncharacterized protein (TIGR02611 family)